MQVLRCSNSRKEKEEKEEKEKKRNKDIRYT